MDYEMTIRISATQRFAHPADHCRQILVAAQGLAVALEKMAP
jgi:hypothetical protein